MSENEPEAQPADDSTEEPLPLLSNPAAGEYFERGRGTEDVETKEPTGGLYERDDD